ncbi:uncharacterized protein METZ01_LOCUS61132 [marine metagenome]|uniref:Uncharacterized protein n=1 Tax=marine metagenome TaxID=408172 RepID=A0A381SY67_9ZZZZ
MKHAILTSTILGGPAVLVMCLAPFPGYLSPLTHTL